MNTSTPLAAATHALPDVLKLSAAALAWMLDVATDGERNSHTELQSEHDHLVHTLQQLEAQGREHRQALAAILLSRYAEQLRNTLFRKEAVQSELEGELHQFRQALERSLQAPGLLPWQRSQTISQLMQTEDALARLAAHRDYRQWYRQQLDPLEAAGPSTELLHLELPSPTVPSGWLYVGKVLRLDPQSLSQALPPYGHRLRLRRVQDEGDWTTAPQEKLALDYPRPDAVPIQVTGAHAAGFEGCIGRGILQADHIRHGLPAEFTVDAAVAVGHVGSLMAGTVRALLPPQGLALPGMRLLPGDTLEVWPEAYDLCLRNIPGVVVRAKSKSFQQIQVNSRPPAQRSADVGWLAMLVNTQLPHADALEITHPRRWRLLELDWSQSRLLLWQNGLRVMARLEPQLARLRIEHIEQLSAALPQAGWPVPLALEPVDERLADDPLLPAPAALQSLCLFALQAGGNPLAQRTRQVQAEFLARWMEVLNYQKEMEMHRRISFTATARAGETGDLVLTVPAHQVEDGGLASWRRDWRDTVQHSRRSPQRELEVWLTEPADQVGWVRLVQAGRNAQAGLDVDLDRPQELVVHFAATRRRHLHSLCEAKNRRYRLSFQLPRADLDRQTRALQDFAEDHLVEPALKPLILAPEFYTPQFDADWQARIAAGLPWANQRLTPTQRSVVQTCLAARHLALVQGPPGTAKTTCIVEMLHQIFTAQPEARVMVVSQQNAAVDNALARFIQEHASTLLESQQVRLMRIGRPDKITDSVQPYGLEAAMQRRLGQWQAQAQSCVDAPDAADPRSAALAGPWLELLAEYRRALDDEPWNSSEELTVALLQGHNLVGATCVGLAATRMGLDTLQFDVAIIDEAGRATVPELLIPMLRARKVILIGDHFQLPPAVAPLLREEKTREDLPFLDQAFLETSFFEQLYTHLAPGCRAQLREQYRMAAPIGDLVAELFYTEAGQRMLVNGERPDATDALPPLLPDPLAWIDVRGQQEHEGPSSLNREEARAVAAFLAFQAQQLATQAEAGDKEVAVITPYSAQKRALLRAIGRLSEPTAAHPSDSSSDRNELRLGGLRIRVDTVDSFQGSEADLVCYSTVRTRGALRFLLDKKRLNVACSRARQNLVFFGDANFLRQAQPAHSTDRNWFADILGRATLFQWQGQPRHEET